MIQKLLIILSMVSFLGACSMFSPKVEPDGRLTKLSRQTKKIQENEQKSELSKILVEERLKKSKRLSMAFPMPKPLTEESLYSAVLRQYQARDNEALQYYVDQFLLRYPNSIFADNSLYLRGQMSLALGVPSEALRDFERISKEYPLGNKYTASLLGKAVAYRKMGLKKFSKQVLEEIRTNYTESPEYYKAELEEKLLALETGE